MNKELLDFLEAQLNSGLDNDTAMRAAINKGYDYVDVSSAIASLGQKKKPLLAQVPQANYFARLLRNSNRSRASRLLLRFLQAFLNTLKGVLDTLLRAKTYLILAFRVSAELKLLEHKKHSSAKPMSDSPSKSKTPTSI